MSAPSSIVRRLVFARDGQRCVSCGATSPLEFQHRAAEGMGGRRAAPRVDEGLTSCAFCNQGYEGHLQARALRHGWKVRRFVVERGIAYLVPVFYLPERSWFELTLGGKRVQLSVAEALRRMGEVYGDAWDDERGVI